GARAGPRRRLPRRDPAGPDPGSAGAPLRAGGPPLPRRGGAARDDAVLAPRRAPGSAVPAARSDQLPQPAHLPRSRRPRSRARRVPLRAAARRLPVPRALRGRGGPADAVRPPGRPAPDLHAPPAAALRAAAARREPRGG